MWDSWIENIYFFEGKGHSQQTHTENQKDNCNRKNTIYFNYHKDV